MLTLFLRGISCWWKVEKTFSSVIFGKYGSSKDSVISEDLSSNTPTFSD